MHAGDEPLSRKERIELWFKIIATGLTLTTIIIGLVQYLQAQDRAADAAQDNLRARLWEKRVELYNEASAAAATIAVTYESLMPEPPPGGSPSPERESKGEELSGKPEGKDAGPLPRDQGGIQNSSGDDTEVRQAFTTARREFWRLYWGNMSLLEDLRVERAMVLFGKAVRRAEESLAGTSPRLSPEVLKKFSYQLAHVLRDSLRNTWNPHNAFATVFDPDFQERTAGADTRISVKESSDPLDNMAETARQAGLVLTTKPHVGEP